MYSYRGTVSKRELVHKWCGGESYPSTSSDSEIEKLELHPEGLYSDSFSFLRLKHEHMFHLKTV